jgi:hypothetical protein
MAKAYRDVRQIIIKKVLHRMNQFTWSEIESSGSFTVAKDYRWGGIVGTLDSLVKDILDLGAAIVGTAVGAVIAVTQEAIGWIHANLGPGGTIGVLSGVAVFVVAAALGAGVGVVLIL